jgi:catechol 2,3-dioxygenase-like lactoylglutathione lyase family enzyme
MLKCGPPLIFLPDLDEARVFYGEVLGLPIKADLEGQIIFALADGALHVFACDKAAPALDHGRYGASVITFEVASLADAMPAFEAKGVRFLHRQPALDTAAGWAYAAFEGPGGLTHELVERRPA